MDLYIWWIFSEEYAREIVNMIEQTGSKCEKERERECEREITGKKK